MRTAPAFTAASYLPKRYGANSLPRGSNPDDDLFYGFMKQTPAASIQGDYIH